MKIDRAPLVSVIIIFYNTEKFIEEAIDSIFAQRYQNWELLLVDDGSTDNSTDIAGRYASQFPGKVSYLAHDNHENRGMSASRNLGVKKSHGEYIALLDADDVWLPHKLEQQVTLLNQHPEAGMIYAPTLHWYSWNGSGNKQTDFVPELGISPNILAKPPTLLKLFLQNKMKPPGTCSVLFRREISQKVGGFEAAFQGLYEDQVFFAKICLNFPVYVTEEYSAKYRQHPDSCWYVGLRNRETHDAELTYLNWLAKYISNFKQNNGEEWNTLRKMLKPYHLLPLYKFVVSLMNIFNRIKWLISHAIQKGSLMPHSKPEKNGNINVP